MAAMMAQISRLFAFAFVLVIAAAAPSTAQFLRPHEPFDSTKAQSLDLTPGEIITVESNVHTAGVFLDVGIKLQYFVFFGKDSGLRPPEPPLHMQTAMVFFAVLCIGIGLLPGLFYQLLPFAQDYAPYTPDHVVTQFQLLFFSGAAFFLFIKYYGWKLMETLTLDFDWLYRVWGRKVAISFTEDAGLARDSIIKNFSKGARAAVDDIHQRHGPQGILARTMPTGRMAFWAIVMLAAYLFLDFLFM